MNAPGIEKKPPANLLDKQEHKRGDLPLSLTRGNGSLLWNNRERNVQRIMGCHIRDPSV
jgi:hypothetical protein